MLGSLKVQRALTYIFLEFKVGISILANAVWIRSRQRVSTLLEGVPVYVINLEYRTDRLNKTVKNLCRMGIKNPQVFKAIEDIYPKRGCSKSHLGVYEQSKRSESEVIFVCEDDVRFVCSTRALELILKDFLIQGDHEVLCLGNVTRSRFKTLSRYLDSTNDVQTTSCYIFKRSIRNELIECAKYSVLTLTDSKGVEIAIDKSWKKLQTEKRFVVPKEKICVQYRGYSDIEKRNVNYLN